MIIKFAARADLHHLGMFLQGRQADAPQEALQVLDIVLRELPTSRYVLLSPAAFPLLVLYPSFVLIVLYFRYCPVGRSFYSPDLGRRQPLGEGLESWRGFYQSIRPTQMGLSLNIGEPLFLGLVVNIVNLLVIVYARRNVKNLLKIFLTLKFIFLDRYVIHCFH